MVKLHKLSNERFLLAGEIWGSSIDSEPER